MKRSQKKHKPQLELPRQSQGFKRKKRDPNSISLLKEKAWKWFSLYVRLVDSDWSGMVHCITCGVQKSFREMQAGHFTPGRRKFILFDKRGCYPQCYQCNVKLKSNPRKYDRFMETKQGADVIAELDRLSELTEPWTTIELKEILVTYKQKALREAQQRGITIN